MSARNLIKTPAVLTVVAGAVATLGMFLAPTLTMSILTGVAVYIMLGLFIIGLPIGIGVAILWARTAYDNLAYERKLWPYHRRRK